MNKRMETPSHLRPLFWQHGETAEILTEEMEQMHRSGIGGVIVESRPHPDYLGYGWWRDLDVILAAADRYGMEVWLFDDATYPSGTAGGKVAKLYPEAVKRFITEHHLDVHGPRRRAMVNVNAWLHPVTSRGVDNLTQGKEETLIAVILAKRSDKKDGLQETSLQDITDQMRDGQITLDIPEGDWRIFILAETSSGGEEWTSQYVNPISTAAVSKYIDIVYEEHYKRYSKQFGRTIKGFFSDEPRFGNVAGYEDVMWKERVGCTPLVYPWSEELKQELLSKLGANALTKLPYLWSNNDEACRWVHYCYMDAVSRLFGKCFVGQIGEWCRNHDVKLIGHFVEDNGAHARLGYGPGHFFRASEGLDAAGMDVVWQIWPGHTQGRYASPFGNLDACFFYWGLAKMTSSAAHIDPKKGGEALCEIFGAYGWQMGLKFMKWLTDHVCVRGINTLVPHAFSPRDPDDDCPPHFYARGNNPQWPYFQKWANYANRVCERLSGGIHCANAAVLYHAEAEWCGKYQPFESVVEALAKRQIDCDVIPADVLADAERCKVEKERLVIYRECYDVLIVPYTQYLPVELVNRLSSLSEKGLPIVFIKDFPQVIYAVENAEKMRKNELKGEIVRECGQLVDWMRKRGFTDAWLEPKNDDVAVYHYRKNGRNEYFVVNENICNRASHTLWLPGNAKWIAYDAMEDREYGLPFDENSGALRLVLDPYQSVFIREAEEIAAIQREYTRLVCQLDGPWQIEIQSDKENKKLREQTKLCNVAEPYLLPRYSGTIIYRTNFNLPKDICTKPLQLNLGEVYEVSEVVLNGKKLGCRIAPPHCYNITNEVLLYNRLEICVTTTLARSRGDNRFDRAMVQEPTGLLGEVLILTCEEETT